MSNSSKQSGFTRCASALLLLLTGLVAAPAAAQFPMSPIALSGQPAPDGNGMLSSLSSPHLNEVGQVAFRAELTGTTPGAGVGLFRGAGGPLTQIVRTSHPSPDGNGAFAWIAPFSIDVNLNDAGQVGFHAGLVGVDGSSAERLGHFVGDGQTTAIIARQGQVTPYGTLSGSISRLAPLNNAGQVAFLDFQRGVFRGEGGSLTPVVLRGQSTPFGTLQFLHEGLGMNDAGQVVFGVNDRGIFRWDEGTLAPVALQGQSTPSGNGAFTFTIPGGDVFWPAGLINNTGQVVFEAFLAGTTQRYGIFLQTGSTLTEIIRASSPIHQYGHTFAVLYAPHLNNAGQVAFISDSQWGPLESAVHFYDGNIVSKIAEAGQAAPDGNGNFAGFGVAGLNDSGQILISAALVNTLGGTTDDFAFYFFDGTDLVQLFRTGDQLDVGGGNLRTIISIASSGPNNQNQVAFRFGFSDQTEGVFLATIPEPATLSLLSLAGLALVRRRELRALN